MKKYILLSLAALMLNLDNVSYAENTYTAGNDYYTIKEILPFSHVEPLSPDWAGMTQLQFTSSITWIGGSGCSTNGVAIRSEDKHILSVVMQAFAMGKPIRLYTDNTQVVGTKCILRAIGLKQ